jgi:hypothetical protein
MPENNGTSRLDRIERALELLVDDHVQFREEHKLLLTAQVLLTEAQKRTEEAQKRTDEKLAALAVTVDEDGFRRREVHLVAVEPDPAARAVQLDHFIRKWPPIAP